MFFNNLRRDKILSLFVFLITFDKIAILSKKVLTLYSNYAKMGLNL